MILTREVHDVVDHAFVVYSGDNEALNALKHMGDEHRTVVVDFIPTAENLAKWAFEQVEPHAGIRLWKQITVSSDACLGDTRSRLPVGIGNSFDSSAPVFLPIIIVNRVL